MGRIEFDPQKPSSISLFDIAADYWKLDDVYRTLVSVSIVGNPNQLPQPSRAHVGEVFSGELDATGDTHVVSAATAFAIWVLLSALGWVVILATIVSITKLL